MQKVVSVASVIAAALFVASSAIGQSNQPAATPDPKTQPSAQQTGSAPGSQSVTFFETMQPDTWRASKLIGKDVHSASGQDIGEVNDVLLGRNGQVTGLVLDVGGFLGIGGSQIAVPMQSVQFSKSSTTGTGSNTASGELPDRITLNVTKEKLQAAPKFEADRSAKK